MLVTVRLNNFRNYDEYTINLGPGLNLVLGENGVGKTNLLEAIFFLLEGRSLKGADVQEMIRNGSDEGLVEGRVSGNVEGEGRVVIRKGEETRRKRFENIRAVAFVPDDVFLVKGNPEQRRRFIDDVIRGIKPAYLELLRDYGRVLRQRNHALKIAKKESWRVSDVESWDILLVRQGMEIVKERREALRILSHSLEEVLREWGMGEVEIKYYSSFSSESEEENLRRIRRLREAEIRRGVSLSGPHRDEILFYLNGRNIRREGSQGEQKMFCLACKLAQTRIMEELTGKEVVLLLDDCFSELDSRNRMRLAESLKRRWQVLVTSTEEVKELGADRILELTRRGDRDS
ncbi:DNA replication and repair protein RecF [Candidatus Solincola tengchongensis]|uniref:DNA replication/repair protein RecF n=1 Tax=Candidatus Solincola tengchongensis TaxID=2900693 RepID=UPI0025806E62|nr:DNA replication and repair protein RecF [Candidatus Solincola tengchongensis]